MYGRRKTDFCFTDFDLFGYICIVEDNWEKKEKIKRIWPVKGRDFVVGIYPGRYFYMQDL